VPITSNKDQTYGQTNGRKEWEDWEHKAGFPIREGVKTVVSKPGVWHSALVVSWSTGLLIKRFQV